MKPFILFLDRYKQLWNLKTCCFLKIDEKIEMNFIRTSFMNLRISHHLKSTVAPHIHMKSSWIITAENKNLRKVEAGILISIEDRISFKYEFMEPFIQRKISCVFRQKGWTALQFAISRQQTTIALILINANCSINHLDVVRLFSLI